MPVKSYLLRSSWATFVFESRMVGFRANSLTDVINGNLIFARMVWIEKSYFGHAREEVLIEVFLGDFVFESRMVGFSANSLPDVIYGDQILENSMNDII